MISLVGFMVLFIWGSVTLIMACVTFEEPFAIGLSVLVSMMLASAIIGAVETSGSVEEHACFMNGNTEVCGVLKSEVLCGATIESEEGKTWECVTNYYRLNDYSKNGVC